MKLPNNKTEPPHVAGYLMPGDLLNGGIYSLKLTWHVRGGRLLQFGALPSVSHIMVRPLIRSQSPFLEARESLNRAAVIKVETPRS